MLKPRHDLQTSYFESSRLLTYFPLTEFCWTQQQPSHCFWHKLPFLTMCEKSWHELSWHLTHLLRSSKNSVEIESARKRPLSTNSTSFCETTFNMLCHYTKCNRKISPTLCHFKEAKVTLLLWDFELPLVSFHPISKQWMSLKSYDFCFFLRGRRRNAIASSSRWRLQNRDFHNDFGVLY